MNWFKLSLKTLGSSGPNIDQIRLLAAPSGYTPVDPAPPGEFALYYIHDDHLGTPQVVTNAQQQVVWMADYFPFGQVVPNSNNDVELYSRFPGQYFDEETGLHYNYFRDYDPSIGRYVQSDPIGLEGGINTYGYGFQSPISNIDPSGLSCVAVGTTVTCKFPGGTVTFPRPNKWPDRIDDSSPLYHEYNIPVSFDPSLAECVMKGIKDRPTPGSPSPATQDGTTNNATPTNAQNFFNTVDQISSFGNDPGGYNNSPVNSYSFDNDNTVVNVTEPGHPLHPGYVARTSTGSQVNNYGEGLGLLQSKYNPLAPTINGVWDEQTQDIIDKCKCEVGL